MLVCGQEEVAIREGAGFQSDTAYFSIPRGQDVIAGSYIALGNNPHICRRIWTAEVSQPRELLNVGDPFLDRTLCRKDSLIAVVPAAAEALSIQPPKNARMGVCRT